eukprot:gnl/TRDRNA2_/TRDRNA2_189450_c0_seq1.p1 gnl/TRDRNA2_/TRDRNA2_189450_c0~~gnl/TRDRNA2_/TRDRNA2_189450_c0_seq1.p1  ORF type:complete len:288 (+),score=34.84 gnl/TRDRNA2_/TRDRNA2_189450_c0_seq1:93-956(+)
MASSSRGRAQDRSPSPIRTFSDRFLFDADGEPQPEEQPLLEPQTGPINRQRFEQNQRQVARRVIERSIPLICVIGFLLLAYFIAALYFYVLGWLVWINYQKLPCDQPLATWLLITLIMPLVLGWCEGAPKPLRVIWRLLPVVTLVLGIFWFFQSKTCAKTNPELYTFVKHYLIFLSISTAFSTLLPIVLVGLMVYGMTHGWFDELNGAGPETIKNLQTVKYDPALFSEEGKSECCCCCEPFDEQKEIKRTPCDHYFHEECLGKWLRVSTTCPLCRNDLDEAVKAGVV